MIGRGIEARLRELVETGEIAELTELERELAPGLVGLGRHLGLGARRSVEIARARSASAPPRSSAAAAAGRLRDAWPAPRPRRGCLRHSPAGLHRGRSVACCSTGRGSSPSEGSRRSSGRAGGDVRRWRDSCDRSAVVPSRSRPPCWSGSPRCRRSWRSSSGRSGAIGLTVEGVPVELIAKWSPSGLGLALLRATGAPAFVAPLEPLPEAPDEATAFAALGLAWWPPELREEPPDGEPPALVETGDIRGDLHCHTTWSGRPRERRRDGRAPRRNGYDYPRSATTHRPWRVRGLTPDDVRRQGEEIAAANQLLAPFRILRGIECDILPDGRLDLLPDDVLAEPRLRRRVHGARMPRREMTRRVEARCAIPTCAACSHRRAC